LQGRSTPIDGSTTLPKRPSIAVHLPVLLLLAGIVTAAWRVPRPATPAFVVPPVMAANERPALIEAFQGTLAGLGEADSMHACTLAMAPDGALLVAWFEGSREGAADVSIRMHRYPPGWCGGWRADGSDRPPADAIGSPIRESWQALTREQLQKLTSRSIRKIGNPVLWFDAAGRLHLSVVSVSLGGWSGSAINQLVSDDGGKTWVDARRLILTPFFNLGSMVRTQPQVLQDGSIGLPAYHEFVQKWGQWIRMTPGGTVLQSTPVERYEGGMLQPAVVAVSPTDAVAAMRTGGRPPRKVSWSATNDAGQTWPLRPDASTRDIPNPDSSVAMIRLQDGSLLMACNPIEQGRNRLQLFRSTDDGATWTPSRTIAASADATQEYSYPALVQSRTGRVHLGFTWQRKAICLCTFSPEWLAAPDDGAAAMEFDPAKVLAPAAEVKP